MTARIILVRHVETVANAAGLWQGATNSGFSPRGQEQLKRIAARFDRLRPDLVVSSDLGRTQATAGALGFDFETDPRWREPDFGSWEGLGFADVQRRHPDQLAALMAGEDIRLGGGERLSTVAARVVEAYEHLFDRMDGNGTAVVVSHGMALMALVAALVGIPSRPAPLGLMANGAVTTFDVGDRGSQLSGYNDHAHLDDAAPLRDGETHVVLVRHGQTAANVQGRWQGHADWPLDDHGRSQAERLAFSMPPVDLVYASPLARAAETAAAVADHQGRPVRIDPDLREIGFGEWENLTSEEIASSDPEGWRALMDGVDVARGRSGETFVGVRRRMAGVIDRIAAENTGRTVGVVSHGGATRAYLTGLLRLDFPHRQRISSLANTATARIVYRGDRAMLGSWNVAPHLED